jgi:hypothetical protein
MNPEQAQIRGLGGGSAMKPTRDSMTALIWLTLSILSVDSDLLWANDRPRLADTTERLVGGSVRAPSTLGNNTYIPVEEFLDRWHDRDQRGKELIHFGIVIDGKKRAYDADEIKSLD